jgi:uncharacterized damage-inducible protein DinB
MKEDIVSTSEVNIIQSQDLLNHWQGHRRLTRRVIDAFPEDKLFNHSVGGMRSFAQLAMELLGIADSGVVGMATGTWESFEKQVPETKEKLLALWDEVTDQIDRTWPQISPSRFQEHEVAYGMYEGKIIDHFFYFVDNEIHHRGQGYVYLRSLGIEPPYFWER